MTKVFYPTKDAIEDIRKIMLWIIILIGMIAHIVPYLYGRSLWYDEAMLASSVLTRRIDQLFCEPLDFGQSAPVGYLFLVKILADIFGGGRTSLRIISLISFFFCVGLFYQILRRIVRTSEPELFTAIFSCLTFYIYYSNEFKPYMMDNAAILGVMFLYGLYLQKILPLWLTVSGFCLLFWFSFPAVFYCTACVILITLRLLRQRNLRKAVAVSAFFAISLTLDYLLWLRPSVASTGGKEYWSLLNFPLLPNSFADVQKLEAMLVQLLAPLGTRIEVILICILSALSLIALLQKKKCNILAFPSNLGSFLMLVASYLGLYPIQDRMVQTFVILLLIHAATGLDFYKDILSCNFKNKKLFMLSLSALLLALPLKQTIECFCPKQMYRSNEELSGSIAYLKDNLSSSDMIYVSGYAIPSFLYETGYTKADSSVIENVPCVCGNCIFGQESFVFDYSEPYSYSGHLDEEKLWEDMELIQRYSGVYILCAHYLDGTEQLVTELRKTGSVQKVSDQNNTPLYYYQNGLEMSDE